MRAIDRFNESTSLFIVIACGLMLSMLLLYTFDCASEKNRQANDQLARVVVLNAVNRGSTIIVPLRKHIWLYPGYASHDQAKEKFGEITSSNYDVSGPFYYDAFPCKTPTLDKGEGIQRPLFSMCPDTCGKFTLTEIVSQERFEWFITVVKL
jgi:hypothetical protein